MVLPIGEFTITPEDVEVVETSAMPTRTYNIDFEKGRIVGMVDGLEAIKQAIYKMLSTIRFRHLIYSDDYGFDSPIGRDEIFARAELPRRIKETLLQDERITDVVDFYVEYKGDSAVISFIALTLYGDANVLREV